MTGDIVGSYRILAPLGAGGMGEVWMAEHVLIGRRVAIKILRPELSERADVVERFFDEARAASMIADAGVVQVHDFGWAHSCAYLVMELLTGESLASRLSRIGSVTMPTAARLAQQIAMTMAVTHHRRIVHRDLKPDNIFLVADPTVIGGERIKILDFGIAKLLGEHEATTRTRTGTILGTPMYMSPEQCKSSSSVDHRTDIYALGCVLFEMVCGRPPFLGKAPAELITAHLFVPPPVPSSTGAPPMLDSLIATCLAKDPRERSISMTEIAQRLAAFVGPAAEIPPHVPMHEVPHPVAYLTTLGTSAGEASTRPAKRARGHQLAAAVTTIAVLAFAGFVVTRTRVKLGGAPIVARSMPAPVTVAPAATREQPGHTTSAAPSVPPPRPRASSPAPRPRRAAIKPPMPTPAPTTPAPTTEPSVDELYEDRGD